MARKKIVSDLQGKELPYSVENEIAGWHQKRTYKTPKSGVSLKVVGMVTGCGIAQMHGVTCFTEEELLKLIPEVIKDYKVDGAGCILATLGKAFWQQHEQKLFNCGFKLLNEYSNYRHGQDGNYHQRLYALTY